MIKFLLLMLFHVLLFATNYYIEYNIGDDTNNGTSTSTPFKHSPDDSLATDVSNSTVFAAGDTVFFKSGIKYPGKLMFGWSGSDGNNLVYCGNKWGGTDNAIIYGSEVISGWQKCPNAETCGDNSNYENMYYAYAPDVVEAITSGLCINDSALWLAQSPLPSDPFKINAINSDTWESVPIEQVTTTTLYDTLLRTKYGGEKLVNKYLLVHSYSTNVNIVKVTSFSNDTAYTSGIGSPTQDPCLYSVLNMSLDTMFNAPGQYFFNDSAEDDGTHKVIMWPFIGFDTVSDTVTVVSRQGSSYSNRDYVDIVGFDFLNMKEFAFNTSSNANHFNVTLNNVNVKNNFGGDSQKRAIYIYGYTNAIIDSCSVINTFNSRGMQISNSYNTEIKNSYCYNIGGTAIFQQNDTNVITINNIVDNSVGSHSNGISIYSCQKSLFASNIVLNTLRPHTFEATNGHIIYNNVLDQKNLDTYVIAMWSGGANTRRLAIMNNIVLGGVGNFSLFVDNETVNLRMKNNIIQGSSGTFEIDTINERSNNLYSAYSWEQSSSYDWYLKSDEIDYTESNINDLFNDTSNLNGYTIKDGALTINAGTTLEQLLTDLGPDVDSFPSYDFTKDLNNNQRDSIVDIGPYEELHVSSDTNKIIRIYISR